MHIAAVATVLNEADILAKSMDHLLHEGVSSIWLAIGPSTDNTWEVAESFRGDLGEYLHLINDPSPFHHQPGWITDLADRATIDGAQWILPFDADEFMYATSQSSIRDALVACAPGIGMLSIQQIRHASWTMAFPTLGTLPKCGWRTRPGPPVQVANGNHSCNAGGLTAVDAIAMRELCYRSFEHFVRKTRERCHTLDPSLPPGEGAHQTRYRDMSEEQLWQEWVLYLGSCPAEYDPIPSRSPLVKAVTSS